MTYTEAWNFLCEDVRKNKNKMELEVQSDWEEYFAESELFGYSKIKNDIVPHPQLVLGSTKREIPDILICRNGEKLFLAELKQYSISLNEKIEKQLLNYLTHTDMHLSIGILVCEKLYVYCYDFVANSKVKIEIPFEKNDASGIKFIELFSKKNFDEKKIQDFVLAHARSAQNLSEIKSAITVELVTDLLKKHFSEKYPAADVAKILEEYNISIRQKTEADVPSFIPHAMPTPDGKDFTQFMKDGISTGGKCPTVYSTVKSYVESHPAISFSELQKAFPDSMAKPGFGKMIRRSKDITHGERTGNRFNKHPITLSDGTEVFVSTQWTPENMENFIKGAAELGIEIKTKK